MEGKFTVRGLFEDGEMRFAEPVDVEGCWKLEITFVEQVDEKSIPLESNPHRPEDMYVPDRLEELHRKIEDQRPPTVPY